MNIKKIQKNKGFTAAEILIVLCILGVITSIMIPAINAIKPDNNRMLFRKAYKEAGDVVGNLVNDNRFYPGAEGFTYGNKANNLGNLSGAKTVNINGVNYAGKNKFCMAFVNKVNIIGLQKNNCTTEFPNNTVSGVPSFTTTDNFDWYIQDWEPSVNYAYVIDPASGVASSEIKKTIINPSTAIFIDVNGNKEPNCRALSYKDADGNKPLDANFNPDTAKIQDTGCKKPDRFRISIRYDGKISFDGEVEQGYLMQTKLIK